MYSIYGKEYRDGTTWTVKTGFCQRRSMQTGSSETQVKTRFWNRNSRKFQLGPRQTDGKNLVWFGEIEGKLAKFLKTTFTYRSSSWLFYGWNPWKCAQIGSNPIHFGLSSANWCGSGSGSWPSLSLWCGSWSWFLFDADPDFYLMRMRIQVAKMMRIRIHNSDKNINRIQYLSLNIWIEMETYNLIRLFIKNK